MIGRGRFRAVVCDGVGELGASARDALERLRVAGGLVVEEWEPEALVPRIHSVLGRDVDWPGGEELRVRRVRKDGRDYYMLVNEGEETLEGELSVSATGALELWDPLDGSVRDWPERVHDGRTITCLTLGRRESAVLVVDSGRTPNADATRPSGPGAMVQELTGPWSSEGPAGRQADAPCPGDWAHAAGRETFSGTVRFRTEFSLTAREAEAVHFMDLGRFGDIAEGILNGRQIGVRGWAPYRFGIAGACRPGRNTLAVVVTNSMANEYDGLQMQSGLIGPVVLRAAAPPVSNASS